MAGIGQGGPRAAAPRDQAVLEALGEELTGPVIDEALRATGRRSRRRRRLPAEAVVWLVVAMGLFPEPDIPGVWRQVCGTLRALWQGAGRGPPCKAAFAGARRRLGARPLRLLFRRTARPRADDRTPGAFYRGLRLMAIDALSLDAPDTPANRAAFGASSNRRGGTLVPGAYPRPALCVLEEVGTHGVCEALVRPFKGDEVAAGRALLKRVPPGSLVLWDRRYYARQVLHDAFARGVAFLGRVGSQAVFTPIRRLPDGSVLARIEPGRWKGIRVSAMEVRVISYTITDRRRPGHGARHRLVTSLLDPAAYPARELIGLYHQRWEIEISNDELKTHQLVTLRPTALRSQTPAGIVQEIYGLLLAYNAVRGLMHRAARAAPIDPRRLSFTHTLRVVRETVPHLRAAPPERLPALYHAMLRHIGARVLPPRANRLYPRVVKRKMSHYLKKRPHHRRLAQPRMLFADAVKVLK